MNGHIERQLNSWYNSNCKELDPFDLAVVIDVLISEIEKLEERIEILEQGN